MAIGNDGFRYIITTELKLAPGNLNNLLNEIKQVDARIRATDVGTIEVGARLNQQSVNVLQRQIGNIRAHVPVRLRIDEASLADFRRRVQELVRASNVDIGVSPAGNRPTVNPTAGIAGTVAQARDQRLYADQLRQTNEMTRRSALNARDAARAELDRARAIEVVTRAEVQRLRLQQALARMEQRELGVSSSRIPATGSAMRLPANHPAMILMKQQQELERLARYQVGRSSRLPTNHPVRMVSGATIEDLEKSLRNPDVSVEQKQRSLQRLLDHNSQLARNLGRNMTSSFQIANRNADGTISKLRTMTIEFTRTGDAIDRGDLSIQRMLKNVTLYTAMGAGIYQVANAFQASVVAMAQFEAQFAKIDTIMQGRMVNGAMPNGLSNEGVRDNIFALGRRYGVDPTRDVAPVMTDLLRRQDLVKNDEQAKMLTQQILKAGLVAYGANPQSDDLQRIGVDFTTIYQNMFKLWTSQGKDAIAEMNNFVDVLAKMSTEGARIDKTLDAVGDLVTFSTGAGGLDINFLSAIVGQAQKSFGDASGGEIANSLKMFFTNLTKPDGKGANEARRILGISSDDTLDTAIRKMIENVQKGTLNDTDLESIQNQLFADQITSGQSGFAALGLASSGGSGGGARAAEFRKLLESMSSAYNLYQDSIGGQYRGEAERQAQKYASTLTSEYQKLIAALQELSVTLGDSGVLSGLKTITRALTSLANGVNSVISGFNSIGDAAEGLFGESLGRSITTTTANIIQLTLALKAAQIAWKALGMSSMFGGGGRSGAAGVGSVAGSVGTAIAGEVVAGAITGPRAANAAGRATGGGLGSRIARFAALDSIFVTATRGLSGFTATLARLLPWLLRLTAIGAVVGGVIGTGAYIYNRYQENREKERSKSANKTVTDLFTGENLDKTKSDLERLAELHGGYREESQVKNPSFMGLIKEIFSPTSKEETESINRSYYGAKAGTPEWEEQQAIIKRLEESGFKRFNSTPGTFEYDYFDQVGDLKRGTSNILDKKSMDDLFRLFSAITSGTGTISKMWQENNKGALNYLAILSSVSSVTEKVENLTRLQNVASSNNAIRFSGATNSRGYIGNEIDILRRTTDPLGSDYNALVAQRELITQQQNESGSRVNSSMIRLRGMKGGLEEIQKLNESFASAKESGSIDTISRAYDPTTGNASDLDYAKYDYIKSMADKELETQALQKIDEQYNKLVDTYTQNISKLKELYSSYLVASSGVQIFDGALRAARSQVQQGQSFVELAVGDEGKVNASISLLGVMGQELSLYQRQLNNVTSTMDSIRSANPDKDFSMQGLYSPDSGTTSEQNAYRELLEKSYEISDSISSSTVALAEQRNAIVDLVVESEKYKTYWDSITQRIELSRSIAGELRGLDVSKVVSPQMTDLRSRLFGSSFDVSGANRENAGQLRDNYLSTYQKASEALVTYGDDAQKLKEVLADINATMSSKFEAAFISPLKEMISTDVNPAIDMQFKAGEAIKEGAETLGRVLDDFARKAGYFDGADKAGLLTNANSKVSGGQFDDIINEASGRFGVPASLIKGMIKQESNFNPNAVSRAGATGLMQLMPGTARSLGVVDSNDPYQNIMGGTQYISQMLKTFGGDVEKALIGYNAGPGNVANVLASPEGSWAEPKGYVQNVLSNQKFFASQGVPTAQVAQQQTQVSAPAAQAATPSGRSLPQGENRAEKAERENREAQQQLLQAMEVSYREALKAQVQYLMSNNIDYTLKEAIREAGVNSSISRVSSDFTLGYYDAYGSARKSVSNAIFENQSSLESYRGELAGKEAQASGASGQQLQILQTEINVLNELIGQLEENTGALEELEKQYQKASYTDPRYNATEATELINARLKELDGLKQSGQAGGVEWYKIVGDINGMFANYMNRGKMNDMQQELFDNTGYGYDRLALGKQIKFRDDVTLLATQIKAVSDVLVTLREGTNDWHVVLEDAVALQEKVLELENKKAATAKRYFELTGKGLYPYINARAYQQSRDFAQNSSNLDTAMNRYKTNRPTQYTEELVSLQIIAETQNQLTDTVNEYRQALVDAFKAGALSLTEYMNKLHDLRDIQRENKEAALEMVNSLQGVFQSSLSDALKSGMQGDFDAGLNFVESIKSGIAGAISSQISTTMLTQSGLMDKVNTMIQGITAAMTSGGTLNFNGMKQLIMDSTNQMLPWIEQIAGATQGMFGIMKDEVFNAPNGFKIDNYLYEMQKGKTYSEVAPWLGGNNGNGNEAGSPNTGGSGGSGGVVVLPPMTDIPEGIEKLKEVVTPIESIWGNNDNGPGASLYNPIKEILGGIMTLQENYDLDKSIQTPANSMLHEYANKLRDALINTDWGDNQEAAAKIAEAIGDGYTGKSLGEISQYMADNNFIMKQFDMLIAEGNGDLVSQIKGTYGKFDALINGVGQVVTAVKSQKEAENPTPNPIPGGSTGGGSTGGGGGGSGDSGGGIYYGDSGEDWETSGGSGGETGVVSDPVKVEQGTSGNGTGSTGGFSDVGWADWGTSEEDTSSGSTGQQAYLEDLAANGDQGQSDWANQYMYLNDLINNGDYGQQAWAEAQMEQNGMPRYHTGGIAGMMNFVNAGRLKPNEMQAVIQNEETIFQKGQLGSLVDGLFGSSSGGGQTLNVNLTISGDASGIDKDSVTRAVQDGVSQAVREMGRAMRLNNLQTKGVSY